ncbi:MATE family efflux transporter [Croceivirga thetidis]|uniref:Multidrug-efflux transporter n=1 Tax=Croceivirga thetidis TaxID=2721623 RepID=A0ABX1GRG6_9FLAO|nr:MATE family efflux transporter [Croceivirga thetidis]NKI31362.1 MATE family efflux transporter [Croceivirga thetidis]
MITKTAVNFKTINRLAIPATISGIAEPLLSITDTAIVGNIPIDGLESLAAVGIVGSFLSMLIWVLGQTRSAISAIISQYLGANKLEEVANLPAQAIGLNITLSFLILGSTFFLSEEIFSLFEAKGKILEFSVSYYSIRVWGFPLTLFTFAIFGIFRGLQNTFYPMLVAIIGAVLNIVLDFVLVYGIEGVLDPLYLEGAAWASLIAQMVMAILAFVLLNVKTKISLKFQLPFNKELKSLIFMALNLFVRTLALNLALMLAVREATALGDEFIGAHTIAINIWLFSAFFIDGYSGAGNSMGGRLLGAKDYNGLWTLAKKINWYGFIVSIVLLVLGFLLYEPLGRLFSKDATVLNAFYAIFYLVLIGFPMNAVAFLFDGMFKGMGEMKYLRNLLLGATLLGFVPTLYLGLHFGLGLHAIWLAFLVWMFFRSAPLVWKFRRKFRPLLQNQ